MLMLARETRYQEKHKRIQVTFGKFQQLFFCLFIYFESEREREHEHRGGAEGEGERESYIGSVLSVQSLMWGWIP